MQQFNVHFQVSSCPGTAATDASAIGIVQTASLQCISRTPPCQSGRPCGPPASQRVLSG